MTICNAIAVGYNLWSFGRLFVRLEIKLDEETEITGEQCTPEQCGLFGSCAVANVRQIRPVAMCEMLIG